MSKVLVEEGNLTNIANAIRAKGNTTAVYKPGEMAAAISNLSTSTSTYVPTDEDLTFRNCRSQYLFAGNQLSWLLNNYKDKKLDLQEIVVVHRHYFMVVNKKIYLM